MTHSFVFKAAAAAGIAVAGIAGAFGALGASAMTPGDGASTGSVVTVSSVTPSTACVDVVTDPADPEHWPCEIEGRPSKLDDGSTRGWYFWHDGGGLHLATTTPNDNLHLFTAVLTTKGVFRDIDKIRLESADDVKLLDHGHKLVVTFHTHDGIDGVNFHVVGGDNLRLRLEQGGTLIDCGNIFIGHDNDHPTSNPFAIHR